MAGDHMYVLSWYGPFQNVQELKEWEDKKGNDTYLYIIRGMKKNKQKLVTYYCGKAIKQSVGKRQSNSGHHIKELELRPDKLEIWVAKFKNIRPKNADVNIIENMFISYIAQCMIGKNEEIANENNLLAPNSEVYIINEWWDANIEEIETYPRGSLYSRIPDVIAYYPDDRDRHIGSVYTSSKLTCRKKVKR